MGSSFLSTKGTNKNVFSKIIALNLIKTLLDFIFSPLNCIIDYRKNNVNV